MAVPAFQPELAPDFGIANPFEHLTFGGNYDALSIVTPAAYAALQRHAVPEQPTDA